jgi:hypothetical protein
LGGFLVLLFKFCKIGKAKLILPMLYLYFKLRNYALVSKGLFFFPLKQENTFDETLTQHVVLLRRPLCLSSSMANVGASRKSQTRKKDSIYL